MKTKTIYYQHTHFARGFDVFNKNPKTRHACLKVGDWCWQNLWEHPFDIIDYIRHKLRR